MRNIRQFFEIKRLLGVSDILKLIDQSVIVINIEMILACAISAQP